MESDRKKKLSYSELRIWQESNDIFFNIVKDCENLPNNKASWIVADQLIRSIGSISANIAEGSGRGTTKDLVRFLIMARGSLVESLNWIDKLVQLGYIPLEKGHDYKKKLNNVNKGINALIGTLRRRESKEITSNK